MRAWIRIVIAVTLLAATASAVSPSRIPVQQQQQPKTPFDLKAVVEQISRKPIELGDRIVINGQRFQVTFDQRGIVLRQRRHGRWLDDIVIPIQGRPKREGNRVTYQTEYGAISFAVTEKGLRFEQRGRNSWLPAFPDAEKRLRIDERRRGSQVPLPLTGEFIINSDATRSVPCDENYGPAVASNGTDYLVVWIGYPDDAKVLGARVKADGTILDTAGFVISSGDDVYVDEEGSIGVAFDGTNYLVVWSGWSESPDGSHIYGARVTPAGQVLDPGTSRLNIHVHDDNEAFGVSVGGRGNGSLVVWQDWDDRVLRATRVSPSGAVLDPAGIVVSEDVGDYGPGIAFDGNNWLVAWTHGGDIWCARVSAATGAVLDPVPIRLTTNGECWMPPRVAFGSGRFAVAWVGPDPGGVRVAWAARVNTNGTVADPGGVQISSGEWDAEGCAIAFDGANFLVCWLEWPDEYLVYAARMNPANGMLLEPTQLCIELEDRDWEGPPAVARGSGNCLLVIDGEHEDYDIESGIFATRIAPPVTVLDYPPKLLQYLMPARDRSPAAAYNPQTNSYLVVWCGSRDGSTRMDIWAARVAEDGVVLDPNGIPICTRVGYDAEPYVIYDPVSSNWLVAWISWRGGGSWESDVRAARVSSTGVVLDPGGFVVSPTATTYVPTEPRIGHNGTIALVVWREGMDGRIWASRVTPAGTVLDPAGIVMPAVTDWDWRCGVASSGNEFLVTWTGSNWVTGSDDIVAARVAANGSVLDPAGILIGSSLADAWSGAPCYDAVSGNYYVPWVRNDYDYWTTSVYVTRVMPSGLVLDPAGILLDAQSLDWSDVVPIVTPGTGSVLASWRLGGRVRAARIAPDGSVLDPTGIDVIEFQYWYGGNPTVAFDGGNWFLACKSYDWENNPLCGAYVSPAGVRLDSFVVASGLRWGDSAALAAGPTGEVLAAYTRRTSSVGVSRTWGRIVDREFVDVATEAVLAPIGTYYPGTPIVPRARIKNNTDAPASATTIFSIRTGTGSLVYADTQTVALAGNASVEHQFASWPLPHPIGSYTARCTTYVNGDDDGNNNALSVAFQVIRPFGSPGWYALADSMTGTAVKDGGGLAFSCDDRLIYEIKGNKTRDFNCFYPSDSSWQSLNAVPAGTANKPVGKGAAITAGGGYVFVMKGNNTREFYKYNVSTRSWAPALRPIPLALDQNATRGKAPKGGGSLAYVKKGDRDYVYVLKGSGTTDFFRYDVAADSYRSIPNLPYKTSPKYDKGSWLCYDGSRYLYVMQNKQNFLCRYDVQAEAWDPTNLEAMPAVGRSGSSKKVGDGSCAACDGSNLWAFKGNNTQEWWRYNPASNTWTEAETIPQAYGTGAKKKKVKSGAGLAYYPDWGVFYAQKGNKSNQFWMYVPGSLLYAERQQREGVAASGTSVDDWRLTLAPNPLRSGILYLRTPPRNQLATLSIYDALGRLVFAQRLEQLGTGPVTLDLRTLPAGVYLVKLSSEQLVATQKLVIER